MDDTVTPIINGISSRPDFVADEPVTAWRNSGRNASDEYSADPTQNSSTMATAKIGLRNSRIGRMGSLALVSHQQKATVKMSAMAPRPRMGNDAHWYCLPPQVVSSTMAVTPATRRT